MGFAGAHDEDLADGAVVDGLLGAQHVGHEGFSFQVAVEDAVLADGLQDLRGLRGVAAEGLGADHRLTGLGGGDAGVAVDKIGQPHHHQVHVVALNGGLHVGGGLGHLPALGKVLGLGLGSSRN